MIELAWRGIVQKSIEHPGPPRRVREIWTGPCGLAARPAGWSAPLHDISNGFQLRPPCARA